MNIRKKYMDKVLKIMELALIKTIPGKKDIFVNFSAHVGSLSVTIYKNGWSIVQEADLKNDFIYIDDETLSDEKTKKLVEDELDNIIKIIEKL